MKFYTKNIHKLTIDFRKNYYLCTTKTSIRQKLWTSHYKQRVFSVQPQAI